MSMTPIPAAATVTWLGPVVAWWSLQVLLMPAGSSAAFSATSETALQVILGMQLAMVSLFITCRSGAGHGIAVVGSFRTSLAMAWTALAPAWPFLLMLCLGTGYPVPQVLYTQLFVLLVGASMAELGQRMCRLPFRKDSVLTLRAGLGVVLGVVAWRARSLLMPWVGWTT